MRVRITVCDLHQRVCSEEGLEEVYVYDPYGRRAIKVDLCKPAADEANELNSAIAEFFNKIASTRAGGNLESILNDLPGNARLLQEGNSDDESSIKNRGSVSVAAARLRARRRVMGVTVERLSELIHERAPAEEMRRLPNKVALGRMIRSWERGIHRPRERYQWLLASALEMPVDELFPEEERSERSTEPPEGGGDIASHTPDPAPSARCRSVVDLHRQSQ